jgi:hypothetical protein
MVTGGQEERPMATSRLRASSTQPHFGFLRVGGLYTQTIQVINEHPRDSVRFSVLPPRSALKPQGGRNKLRLYFRELIKLAPGMSMSIDMVLFAAEPAKFNDYFEVSGSELLTGQGTESCVTVESLAATTRFALPRRGK